MFVPRAGYFGVRSAFWYCMRIYRGEMPPKIARNQKSEPARVLRSSNVAVVPTKVGTGSMVKLAAAAFTGKPLLTSAVKSAGTPLTSRAYSRKFSAPFKSFVTSGVRVAQRKRREDSGDEFAYHLSEEELQFLGGFAKPMKDVPANERAILTQGQREAYLNIRYGYSPDDKYNFPEATSWRIGWFHKNEMLAIGGPDQHQDKAEDTNDANILPDCKELERSSGEQTGGQQQQL